MSGTNATPRNIHLALDTNEDGQVEMRVAARLTTTQPLPVTLDSGAVNLSFDATSYDSFGRFRISNPFTLFDSQFRYGDNTSKWNQSTSGGTSVSHASNESSMLLTVNGTSGDSVIRETKRVFNYQPGKSLLILNTFVMAPLHEEIRQRVGYFGSQNGIYFEADGTFLNLILRKYTSGVVDDTTEKINQTAWNGDRLDGSNSSHNPSGLLLDPTKAQIFWCDVEWLGVGSVRAGFVIDGKFIVCHTFHHANIFDKVYMTTATLPVRYEIAATGTVGGTHTMRQICSTVISEGGFASTSRSRSASSDLGGVSISQTNITPIISIRLKSTRLDSVVFPSRGDLYGYETKPYKWVVIVGGTLSNASTLTWVDTGSTSSVEYCINATTISGGTVIDQGIFVGGTGGRPTQIYPVGASQDIQLTRLLDGTAEILTIAALATTNNDKAMCSIAWEEY